MEHEKVKYLQNHLKNQNNGLENMKFPGHHIDERACGNSRAGVNYKKVEFPWVIMVFDLLCSWIFQAVPHDLAKFSRGASLFSLEFLRVKWHLKIPHGYVLRRTIPIPHLHLPPFPHPARPVNDCDCYSCLLFLAGSQKKPHLRC